jgi:hypothetical protein
MGRDTYHCPACNAVVDGAATICSNPVCRVDLAFCSHCYDITNYTLAEPAKGRLDRDKYRCARCQRLGVRCATQVAGGYCNGLARAGDGRIGKVFCSRCSERAGEIGRTVVGWSVIGALGGIFKPRK